MLSLECRLIHGPTNCHFGRAAIGVEGVCVFVTFCGDASEMAFGRRSGFGRCPARFGVEHDQGAVRWPATRAGCDPARNLNEWPLVLLDAGPEPGRWLKPWSRPPQPQRVSPHHGARSSRATGVAGARAGRRQERQALAVSRGASRLDEVGNVLPRWEQVPAVVAPNVRACLIEGVQQVDRVDLGHALSDLFRGEPLDWRSTRRTCAQYHRGAHTERPRGDDTTGHVRVDARRLRVLHRARLNLRLLLSRVSRATSRWRRRCRRQSPAARPGAQASPRRSPASGRRNA